MIQQVHHFEENISSNVDEINEIVSKMTGETNQLCDIPINILTSIST